MCVLARGLVVGVGDGEKCRTFVLCVLAGARLGWRARRRWLAEPGNQWVGRMLGVNLRLMRARMTVCSLLVVVGRVVEVGSFVGCSYFLEKAAQS